LVSGAMGAPLLLEALAISQGAEAAQPVR